MKSSAGLLAVVVTAATTSMSTTATLAADKAAAPGAAKAATQAVDKPAAKAADKRATPELGDYQALISYWTGALRLTETGKKPVVLKAQLGCSKAASGWALRCEFGAKDDKQSMTAAYLLGVDRASGTRHFYSVNSDGESRDMQLESTEENVIKASYKTTSQGKQISEELTFTFRGQRGLEMLRVISVDGKQKTEMFAKMRR